MATFPFNTANNPAFQSQTLRDAKGNTGKFAFYINAGAAIDLGHVELDAAIVLNAYAAMSNAAVQATHGLLTQYGPAQYGAHSSGGAYESIIDKAVLVFQDTTGQLHRFEVAAPKIAIFKTDKITVDPANGLVSTFTTAMTAAALANGSFVVTRQNLVLANFMGGFYKARKIRRRLNVLILQPDLTPSLPAE